MWKRQGGVQYAGQKKAGASVGIADTAQWTVAWTAPKEGGPVIFHVSANAADGNESADGDFVYTGNWRIGTAGAPCGLRQRWTSAGRRPGGRGRAFEG